MLTANNTVNQKQKKDWNIFSKKNTEDFHISSTVPNVHNNSTTRSKFSKLGVGHNLK